MTSPTVADGIDPTLVSPAATDAGDRAARVGPINFTAPANKLGIADYGRLQAAERDITAFRAAELVEIPAAGAYDLKHLQTIHRRLFSDVYPHAGKLRTESISKLYVSGGEQRLSSSFARPQDLRNNAGRVFNHVAADRQFRGTTDREFDEKMGRLYADINTLHPFKEGNGRAQRAFLRQLALESGRDLDFRVIGPDQNNRAASLAHEHNDTTGLRDIINAARTGRGQVKTMIPQPSTASPSAADLRAALAFTACAQKLYEHVEQVNAAATANTPRLAPAITPADRRILVGYAEVLAERHAQEPLSAPARNAQMVAGGLAVIDHPKDANPFQNPALSKIYGSQLNYSRHLDAVAERAGRAPEPELER